MPTLVSANAPLTPLMLPSTSELLCATCAFAPIAVALSLPDSTFVLEPSSVWWEPVGLEISKPASPPIKVLPPPLVFPLPASLPKKELLLPSTLLVPALCPKKELQQPPTLLTPADAPKKELEKPV